MHCSKKQACAYFLALVLIPLNADSAPLSITDAVGLARKNNLDLREQQVQSELAERQIDSASVFFQENPEIEGQLGRRTGSVRSNDLGIRLTHPLPLSFARSQRVDAAERNAKAQQFRLRGFSNSLVGAVRSLYHTVLASQEVLAIAERESDAAQKLAVAAQERARLGDIAPFEASLARNEAVIVARRLTQAVASYRTAVMSLNSSLGLPVSAETQVELILPPPSDLTREVHRPEIEAAVEAQRSAESKLSAAKRSRLPTLRVWGGLQTESGTDRIASVGLSVPLPLYSRNQSEIAEARAEVSQREIDAVKTRRLIEQQLTASKRRLESARELFLRVGEDLQTPSMTPALEEAFRAGRFSLNELIVAQRQLFELQRTLIEARLEYQLAWEEYQAAQGVFSDDQK